MSSALESWASTSTVEPTPICAPVGAIARADNGTMATQEIDRDPPDRVSRVRHRPMRCCYLAPARRRRRDAGHRIPRRLRDRRRLRARRHLGRAAARRCAQRRRARRAGRPIARAPAAVARAATRAWGPAGPPRPGAAADRPRHRARRGAGRRARRARRTRIRAVAVRAPGRRFRRCAARPVRHGRDRALGLVRAGSGARRRADPRRPGDAARVGPARLQRVRARQGARVRAVRWAVLRQPA